MYASGEEHGEIDTLHKVEECFLRFFTANMSVITGPLFSVEGPRRGKRLLAKQAQDLILTKVKAGHGRIEKVCRPGARGVSKGLKKW